MKTKPAFAQTANKKGKAMSEQTKISYPVVEIIHTMEAFEIHENGVCKARAKTLKEAEAIANKIFDGELP